MFNLCYSLAFAENASKTGSTVTQSRLEGVVLSVVGQILRLFPNFSSPWKKASLEGVCIEGHS